MTLNLSAELAGKITALSRKTNWSPMKVVRMAVDELERQIRSGDIHYIDGDDDRVSPSTIALSRRARSGRIHVRFLWYLVGLVGVAWLGFSVSQTVLQPGYGFAMTSRVPTDLFFQAFIACLMATLAFRAAFLFHNELNEVPTNSWAEIVLIALQIACCGTGAAFGLSAVKILWP